MPPKVGSKKKKVASKKKKPATPKTVKKTLKKKQKKPGKKALKLPNQQTEEADPADFSNADAIANEPLEKCHDSEDVQSKKSQELYPVGSRVTALYPADNQWYPGTISGFSTESQYSVVFDGFDTPETVEQVKPITEDEVNVIHTPTEETETDTDTVEESEPEVHKEEPHIPQISAHERLGNYGLQELAAAGIHAVNTSNYAQIKEYLTQASKAENGDVAAMIATGDTMVRITLFRSLLYQLLLYRAKSDCTHFKFVHLLKLF